MGNFYTEIKRKARKEHKCYWCECTIFIGEHYFKSGGVHRGNFGFRKECLKCNNLIGEYCSTTYYEADYGIEQDSLRDFWRKTKCHKCINFMDDDCIASDMMNCVRCDDFKNKGGDIANVD